MRLGVGDNMYMYLTDKAWQKQRAEKLLQKEEQEGENGKKKGLFFFLCLCKLHNQPSEVVETGSLVI